MKLVEIRNAYAKITEELCKVLSREPGIPDLAEVLAIARGMQKTLHDGAEETAKSELISVIKKGGKRPPNLASFVMSSGGWRLMMHPTREGLDPKKVQARIVAKKGANTLGDYMTMIPTYAIPGAGTSEDKRLRKLFSIDELKEMEYDESWTVKTPTEES